MTELEILQHAKDYLDKLAKGIDPLTDREVPENDIINNICGRLFRWARTSRTCPPSSSALAPRSARGLKNWG